MKTAAEIPITPVFEAVLTEPQFAAMQPTVLCRKPWIVCLDNFVTAAEVEEMLTVPDRWQLSHLTTGADDKYRSSSSFHCSRDILKKPVLQQMHNRIAEVAQTPPKQHEALALTRYTPTQFFGRHHDYIYEEHNPANWRRQGPRIFTMLIYLSEVDAGGETFFFHLDIKIKPQLGRAIFWTNVFPDDPLKKDEMAAHEALPVDAGVKYVAQTWLHPWHVPIKKG